MSFEQQSVLLSAPVTKRDHRQGPSGAKVTLVEYADYECPYSAEAHVIIKQLQARWGDRLCFVYRHFPKVDKHPHAELAAEAAEEAGAQGDFWHMHDLLFEHQDALELPDLLSYAETMKLDPVRFGHKLAAHSQHQRIVCDVEGAVRSGVVETPTFFINGRRFTGDTTDKGAIEAALELAAANKR